MAIELTTADSNTINSIRETLSAAETSRIEAPKNNNKSINNSGEGNTTVTFQAVVSEGPEGTLGRLTVTFPSTDELYQRQLLRRLRIKYDEGGNDFRYNYSNVKVTINPGEGQIVANVLGMEWSSNNDVYDIYVDQAPTPDPYTVTYIDFDYKFVNTVGVDVPNDVFGMATDDDDIDIVSGRDIDLRAADDVYISAGSYFELEHNRLDGQSEEQGIDLITNNAGSQYTWTFNFLGDLSLPGNVRFNKSNSQASSILSHPLSSGDGFGYTTLELHPDSSRSSADQYIIIDPTAPNHIHIRAGGMQDNSSAELILGGENSNVKIGAYESPSVYVKADNKNWEFGVNGFMYFPDGGALKIRGSAPGTSIGTEGDEAGMIAFDNDYFYYCTATWNGETNIWKRVQFSASTW